MFDKSKAKVVETNKEKDKACNKASLSSNINLQTEK